MTKTSDQVAKQLRQMSATILIVQRDGDDVGLKFDAHKPVGDCRLRLLFEDRRHALYSSCRSGPQLQPFSDLLDQLLDSQRLRPDLVRLYQNRRRTHPPLGITAEYK